MLVICLVGRVSLVMNTKSSLKNETKWHCTVNTPSPIWICHSVYTILFSLRARAESKRKKKTEWALLNARLQMESVFNPLIRYVSWFSIWMRFYHHFVRTCTRCGPFFFFLVCYLIINSLGFPSTRNSCMLSENGHFGISFKPKHREKYITHISSCCVVCCSKWKFSQQNDNTKLSLYKHAKHSNNLKIVSTGFNAHRLLYCCVQTVSFFNKWKWKFKLIPICEWVAFLITRKTVQYSFT